MENNGLEISNSLYGSLRAFGKQLMLEGGVSVFEKEKNMVLVLIYFPFSVFALNSCQKVTNSCA